MIEGYYHLLTTIVVICGVIWGWILTHQSKFRDTLMNIWQSNERRDSRSTHTLRKIVNFLLFGEDTYLALNLLIVITIICNIIGIIFTHPIIFAISIVFFVILLSWILVYVSFVLKITWGRL